MLLVVCWAALTEARGLMSFSRPFTTPLALAAGAVLERGDSRYNSLHGVHFCANERR